MAYLDISIPTHDDLRVCANELHQHRETVVTALIAGIQFPRVNRFDDPPALFSQRVGECLDLLIGYLEGRPDFGALYVGQRNVELFQLEKTRAENLEICQRAVAEDGAVLSAFMATKVSAKALAAFEQAYQEVTSGLINEASHHVRTLFIGDCFAQEIMCFLVGSTMNEGLSIDPFAINPRDVSDLRRILGTLVTKNFDVIIFSPFTHNRLPELKALINPKRAFMPRAELEALVDSVIHQTQVLLEALLDRFECPIFVHNAGFVLRATNTAKRVVRLALSHRARRYAQPRINQWLANYAVHVNQNTFHRMFVLEETALVGKSGRLALGQYLNVSDFQHSTVFAQQVAPEYQARIGTVGRLLGRKLVICDIASWREGFQSALKRLKEHAGVVLSIASDTDPAKVHFNGGALVLADFVASQIDGGQKSTAIGRIKSTLNLQTKHMVFIGDQANDRAQVREAFPDLLTLDPGDPQTWKRIHLWGDMAYGSSDLDRTRLYLEQARRQAAGNPDIDTTDQVDPETLKNLGLVISVRSTKRDELKRVVELINRTNQWNLCGTRTTFEQVRNWHASDKVQILLASAADRFGDMGIVCVAVVHEGGVCAEIPVFVLSCRVFGYGVESAMLSEISRRCNIGTRHAALVGHFRSNVQNHPCRNMYTEHGFTQHGDTFQWNGRQPLPSVPWAEVRAL